MQETKITQVFGITPSELKESILQDVRTELQEMSKNFQPVQPAEYLTRQETAELLKVSLVTLSDWNKKGVIKPYRLGNLIRYKRAEIETALLAIHIKGR